MSLLMGSVDGKHEFKRTTITRTTCQIKESYLVTYLAMTKSPRTMNSTSWPPLFNSHTVNKRRSVQYYTLEKSIQTGFRESQ